jgi:hypothetical protein
MIWGESDRETRAIETQSLLCLLSHHISGDLVSEDFLKEWELPHYNMSLVRSIDHYFLLIKSLNEQRIVDPFLVLYSSQVLSIQTVREEHIVGNTNDTRKRILCNPNSVDPHILGGVEESPYDLK